jgi:hypothetical protein
MTMVKIDNRDEIKANRAARAFDLRLQGLSMREIGSIIGCHYSTVSRDIDAYMAELVVPKAETYRAVYNARYERMLARLNPAIESGEVDAINTAARLLVSLAKLNGVDSPARSEKTIINVTPQDIEIREMIQQMERRNDATRLELA